jgi:hypothetical protein
MQERKEEGPQVRVVRVISIGRKDWRVDVAMQMGVLRILGSSPTLDCQDCGERRRPRLLRDPIIPNFVIAIERTNGQQRAGFQERNS